MILRPLFCFKEKKNTGLVIFNSLKQKKLIFNFFVNRNWKKLTDSRKKAKILADNRKSHHPIETLYLKISSFTPVLSLRIVLDSFYLLIFYSEKFSSWIWCLPLVVYVALNLSNFRIGVTYHVGMPVRKGTFVSLDPFLETCWNLFA